VRYYKQIFLTLSTCMLLGCGGDNTTTSLIPDVTSVSIDEENITIYPTDTYTNLHATASYTDGSQEDVSTYLVWSESNSSLIHMSVNTIEVIANGGDANITAKYASFHDTKSVHIHTLQAFHVLYPEVNATGEYLFEAQGDFDNNETNRTLVKNVQWSATNDANISVDEDGIVHITFYAGETNVTTSVFNETNTSVPLAPQSKIFTIE